MHSTYREWADRYDANLNLLRRVLPADKIPEDPQVRARLVADLEDSGGVLAAARKRKPAFAPAGAEAAGKRTHVDTPEVTEVPEVTEIPEKLYAPACGDTSEESAVRGAVLKLSNFHLGLGGDESSAMPAEFGMSEDTFKVDGFDGSYGTRAYLRPYSEFDGRTGPLRQDGTAKRAEDEAYYGHQWREEYFARRKILEADPWYQLLVEIAGGSNTTVERLQAIDNIGARELSYRLYAERQSSNIRAQFEEYRQAMADIGAKKREIQDIEARRPSLETFQRIIQRSSDALHQLEASAVVLAQAVWRHRYYRLFFQTLVPLLKPAVLGATSAVWETANRLGLGVSQREYLQGVEELLKMIQKPQTTVRGLVATLEAGDDAARIGVSAEARDPLGTVDLKPFDRPVYASEYERREADEARVARIRANATGLLDLANEDADGTPNAPNISAKLMFLLLFYGVERGVDFPAGGGDGITSAVRDQLIAAVSATRRSEPLVETVREKYINVMEASRALFAGATSDPAKEDLTLMVQRYEYAERDNNEALKNDMIVAWSFLLYVEDDVLDIAGRGSAGVEALLRSSRAVRMAEIRAKTNPIETLQLATQDVWNALGTFENLSTSDVGRSVDDKIARLRTELGDLEGHAAELARIASGGAADRPDQLPYIPDPTWVTRPEFTGRVTMQPIVRNAINQAYTTIKRFAPQVVGGADDEAGMEKLVTNTALRPYFVEIIVMWMHRTRQRFQVNWLPPAHGETLRSVRDALMGLRTASGVRKGLDPFAFRSPRPSEIAEISQTVPRGMVYDPH